MEKLRLQDISDIANLKKAIKFVKQDKEDEDITCPLHDLPYFYKIEDKLHDLKSRMDSGTYQPEKCIILERIKSSFTTRPISYISIEDWIVAQAILNKVGPILDEKIPQNSYAFRVNHNRDKSNKRKFFKAWYRDWPKFIRSIRDHIKGDLPCLLVTDIAGYFENIDLDRLKQMILDAGISQEVADLLAMQLESWVWRYLYVIHRQRGLLQGNDASSLYANFYLFNMDAYFENAGITYNRFMDDINIHVRSKSEAKRILGDLNRILRNKGLTINTAKTHILADDEIEEHFLFSVTDEIEKLLKDIKELGDSSTLKDKRKDIHICLESRNRINSYLFKRLVTAYIRTRDDSLYERGLEYLEKYPDLTEKLCKYFNSLTNCNQVASGLLAFLKEPERNLFPSQEQRILECLLLLDITNPIFTRGIVELSDTKVHDNNYNYYSRSLYALLLYKYGNCDVLEKAAQLYLNGQEQNIILKKHLALCATRLTDKDEVLKVTERLKREANPELTDLGVFIEEAQTMESIKDLLKHINLKVFHFGKDITILLGIRDVILLNILKFNTKGFNTQLLQNHINRYKEKLGCRRTLELLEEIEDHLSISSPAMSSDLR